MGKRVFVTGGTGFVGSEIIKALRARGDRAVVLTRSAERARSRLGDDVELVEGDSTCAGDWQASLGGVDAIVNLAGQGVGDKRWNAHYKQLLHDSRVDTTRYLVEGIAALEPAERPAVLVSASGIDFYGFTEEEIELDDDPSDDVDESAPRGDSALAKICRDWEWEAREATKHDVRVTRMRLGLVLGKQGALPKIAKAFKWFVGGKLGKGKQWMSWIHIDDVVGAFLHALDNESLQGPVNVVAPNPERNRDFTKALGKVLGRPTFMPIPGFAVKALAGELAEYTLNGRRAVPKALLATGYQFRFPNLTQALTDLYP